MKDHSKPSLRENPDHFILHAAINNLNSCWEPDLTTESIVNVVLSMKNEEDDVIISNIVKRSDEFKEKATEVNAYFKTFCKERNIF